MRAYRALTWHRCVAAVYILGGLAITALAVGQGDQRVDASGGWLGTLIILVGAATFVWQMRELDRERVAPTGLVLDSRAGSLVRRVLPVLIMLAFSSTWQPARGTTAGCSA
jgi:protein-S-isoprenylcysteine O-methyltransferase Ste14